MELHTYLDPIRKWWWVVIAAGVVGMLACAAVLSQRPPTYQARAALMIGRIVFDPNPTTAQLGLGERLADTYAALARRDPVRNAAMAALGLNQLPLYETRSIPEAQLVEILVTDTSPERAQAVANEVANQVIHLSPTGPSTFQEGRQLFINSQLDFLQRNIQDIQNEMTTKQNALAGLASAVEISRAQDELIALQAKLTALQSNYATLLANSEGGAVNYLTLVEPASLPSRPVGLSNLLLVLLAGLAGGGLGCGTAYLLESMDTSIKTPDEAVRLLPWPVIGTIGEIKLPGKGDARAEGRLVNPREQPGVMEALRVLWTNLEFASVDRALQVILVASPGPDEGKTTIASNLAVAMTQAGKKVALLDADMRRPAIHTSFDVPLQPGLSDVFLGRAQAADVVAVLDNGKLLVVPAGTPPPNPTELLSSRRMDEILAAVRGLADILVIDAPPFGLADASVLASKADGVIVIVRPGFTSRNGARAMQAQLERAGATVLGMVFNRASRAQKESLAGYGDYLHVPGESDPGLTVSETPTQDLPGSGEPGASALILSSDPPAAPVAPFVEVQRRRR